MEGASDRDQVLARHAADVDACPSDHRPPGRLPANHRGLDAELISLDCGGERCRTLSQDDQVVPFILILPFQHVVAQEVVGILPQMILRDLQDWKDCLFVQGVNSSLPLALYCDQPAEREAPEVVRGVRLLQTEFLTDLRYTHGSSFAKRMKYLHSRRTSKSLKQERIGFDLDKLI